MLSIILVVILLKEVSALIKVCQRREVFLHDLMAMLESTKAQLRTLFITPDTRFKGNVFKPWVDAVKVRRDNLDNLVWDVDRELALKTFNSR